MLLAVSDKLKILTEKIYEEGVFKAKEESARILQQATEEAARIRAEAQKEKELMLAQARDQAEAQRKKTESELRLAARKATSKLKEDLRQLLTEKVIANPVHKGLSDPETLARILVACMESLTRNKAGNFEVSLPPEQAERVKEALEAGKHQTLASELIVGENQTSGSGFEIIPEDAGYRIRFDESFFVAYLADFLSVETRQWVSDSDTSSTGDS